jgi:hypothetical protein
MHLITCRAKLGVAPLLLQLFIAVAPPAAFAIDGPFFTDSKLMQVLECPDANCDGPLSFGRLMNSTLYARGMKAIAPGQNPFIERPAETSLIVQSIQEDLDNIRVAGGNPPFQLDPRFLVHPAVRVNLVGIVNRMDRQFHRDQRESDCGEISLIYRFAYPLSRLPATMNIVFPAAAGKLDCKTAARGWLTATAAGPTMSPQDLARLLMSGPLSHLKGKNIARLELNMQAYRKPASLDYSDFGSEATSSAFSAGPRATGVSNRASCPTKSTAAPCSATHGIPPLTAGESARCGRS